MEKRTIEDIHKEYADLCAQAGHHQYQIETLKNELASLNGRLLALNKEAAKLNKEKTNE